VRIKPLNNKLAFWLFVILTIIDIGIVIFHPLMFIGKIFIGASLALSVVNIPLLWKYKF
jgi:hypothetical protein